MDLTSRTTRGISGTMMAMITAASPARNSDTTAMASRIAGIAMRPSISRMMTPSSHLT